MRNFQGGLTFIQEGLRFFHKRLGFFGMGLRCSSSVWVCFSEGYIINYFRGGERIS